MVLDSAAYGEAKHMKKFYIFTVLVWLFLAGCAEETIYDIKSVSEGLSKSGLYEAGETVAESVSKSEQASTIFVYVCGEVVSPGVYELDAKSRIYEAIEAAGGLTEAAEGSSINMAQTLTDGQQITVYAKGEEAPDSAYPQENSGKVNINTAGKEELMTLSGIGETRAEDIINYRTEYGGFSSIEDIKNVSGIGDKMFEKLQEHIEV